MQIAIKNPAIKDGKGATWGDEYFGAVLERELNALGCTVRQEFWPNWKDAKEDDVILVLRGLRRWSPPKGVFSILWLLSHPNDVTQDELEAFDLVLTASRTHAKLLEAALRTPVRVARQCTDHRLFQRPAGPIENERDQREGIIYVARSRGVRRDMAQWIVETGIDATIYGNGWERYGLGRRVHGKHIANDELPRLYRRAWLGLNDHWMDMRAFGYINNRILDCLGCGLPVVTDEFPELRDVFGDALLYANDARGLISAMEKCQNDYMSVLSKSREKWNEVVGEFTFERRAAEILEWIERPPSKNRQSICWEGTRLPSRMAEVIGICVYHEEQRVAFLEGNLRETYQELKRSKDAVREQGEKIEDVNTKLKKVRQKENEREKELAAATKAIAQLEKKLSDESQAKRQLEVRLQSLYQSLSWRMTRPLRMLKKVLTRRGL